MDANITFEAGLPVLRIGDVVVRGTQRLDRYFRPGKLFKRAQEVEKWRLEDGRILKASRPAGEQRWSLESME